MTTLPDEGKDVRSDPRVVRIDVATSKAGEFFMLDDGVPTVQAGWPSWTDVARTTRRALPVWDGSPAWRLQIPVLCDAYGGNGRVALVERQWNVIRALYGLPSEGEPPPPARLAGSAIPPHLLDSGQDWQLVGVDETTREYAVRARPVIGIRRGDLIRWQVKLTFVLRGLEKPIRVLSTPGAGYRMHVVKKGETLRSIAQAELGSQERWRDLLRPNGQKIKDPSSVKVGDPLKLPPRGHA